MHPQKLHQTNKTLLNGRHSQNGKQRNPSRPNHLIGIVIGAIWNLGTGGLPCKPLFIHDSCFSLLSY
ncbi:hypothetical protein EUGRSUZ_H01474 [Eucalyptus grandis]|uniref:Uncharacterized protein n=2 Tax=Eucalyptus grandis TaxID=71139 RepID=A0ACC3JPC6_EUCGR|nr:hypothetical protein EUGRSUZ_H01474 [Eucalyptus grandis]